MSTCPECQVKAGFHAPSCSRSIRQHSVTLASRPRIYEGVHVTHIPSNTVRRVTGVRGTSVHFSQAVKHNGKTEYWAHVDECLRLGGVR